MGANEIYRQGPVIFERLPEIATAFEIGQKMEKRRRS